MEVLDKNCSLLKSQSWNQTQKEITKICEFLSSILEYLGQGKNIQPYITTIIDSCLLPGSARAVRKLAYIITKQSATLYDIPWSTVSTCVSQDLSTPSDSEFLIYALRMLYILPLDLAIQNFLSHEALILTVIQGKHGEVLRAGFLTTLPGIMIRVWCGLGSENFQLQDAIKEIFKYILSFLADLDDNLCIFAFNSLGLLFQESEEGKLRGLSQELEANGSDFDLLTPLISYLCKPHLSNLALIICRINAINFRMRVKAIYPLTKLVVYSQNPLELKRLEEKCLLPCLSNLEKGIVWQVAKCLNLLKPEVSTIWTMCNSLLNQSPSEPNPTTLLLLVMEGMSSLPVSLQINLALETLKHANRVQSQVDRFSVLLSCLDSIVVQSMILLQGKEQSAVYQLFSQTWFVEMWMSIQRGGFREDILACLIEACLWNHDQTDAWITVGLEVIDVCFKVLDWPFDEGNTACYTYFFLLFEEVCISAKDSPLADRVQGSLENLLDRLALETSTQLSHYAFNLSLLVCSKYWNPLNEESLFRFMEILKIRLFSAEHLESDSLVSKQCTQFLLCSCFHLARRFAVQAFEKVLKDLQDLYELYEQGNKEPENIVKIIEHLRIFSQSPALIENEFQGYYSMMLERIHIEYDEITELKYDSMHAALNIFNTKRNECFSSERPLELLRLVQPVKELNWRCLASVEVTGICDPLRGFCTHVIYPQYSLIVFCATFYNNTKFQLRNISVKFYCSQNLKLALKQRNVCTIEEISTNEVFEWKVRAVIFSPGEISGSFLFEFNDSELPSPCSYRSTAYTVPVPDILLRDISSGKLFSKFILLWVRLKYSITVRCELQKDFSEMTEEVGKNIEQIPAGQENRAAFQGVTLQGDRIALYITGSEGSKNVRIEYKTNSLDLLRNFTNQTEVFIGQISQETLKLVS